MQPSFLWCGWCEVPRHNCPDLWPHQPVAFLCVQWPQPVCVGCQRSEESGQGVLCFVSLFLCVEHWGMLSVDRCWIVSCSWESHQMNCQIWMQVLTVERKSWLRFSPVVSVFATGPGNGSLHCNGWLNVWFYWKKKISPLKCERWEKELNWTKLNTENPFRKHTRFLRFIANLKKIVWDLWWATASRLKTWNKWCNLNCDPS